MSNIPSRPDFVTVEHDGTDVRFSWTAPNDNFETITAYKLEIRNHNNEWIINTEHCDASQGDAFTGRTCKIPMIELATLTSLVIDTPIKARVHAFNSNGWSEPSEPNIDANGAVIHSVPL